MVRPHRRPSIAVLLALAGASFLPAPGRAQIVQFLDVPTSDEIAELFAGRPSDADGGAAAQVLRSGQTARVIRDEPVLPGAPGPTPAASAAGRPSVAGLRPPRPRPAGAAAVAFADRFAPNSARLPPRTLALLDNTAEAMRRSGGVVILISGHTDAVGNDADNAVLSLRRAGAAAEHLLRRHGIEPGRITVTGAGSSQPLPGSDPAAPDNRRIQLTATPPQGSN